MPCATPTVLIGVALWSSAVTAVCTGWDHDHRTIQDGATFSTLYSQVVDTFTCPADSPSPCHFKRKSYDVTVERILEGEGVGLLDLPEDEADAIFQLAQDGFNEETPELAEPWEFKTISATVSNTVPIDATDYDLMPGLNSSLEWLHSYGLSVGVLSGCTNETLNNLTVTARTPYFHMEPRLNNQTVLAGTWGVSGSRETPIDNNDNDSIGDNNEGSEDDVNEDGGSGATSLKNSATVACVIATIVLACIF